MTEVAQDEDGLDPRRVSVILAALGRGDGAALAPPLGVLHSVDIADLPERISPVQRRALLAQGAAAIDGEVLSGLDMTLRGEVIAALPQVALGGAMRGLDNDDVVDIVEDLGTAQPDMIFAKLQDGDRMAVEQALAGPEA